MNSAYYKEELNNIIAFVGERGSGKSSCMLSFMESLRSDSAIAELKKLLKDANGTKDLKNNEQVKPQILYKQLDDESYKLNASDFHISDIIDPSFFDQSCNILDIILGKLFKNFKDHTEKVSYVIDEEYSQKKRELIGYFQKTKEQVDAMMDKNKKSNDSLDCLLKLSSGTELKDTIRELVDAYLNYFGHNPKKGERFLVIPIDDIDLNTEHAYKMVEQVRKYFIQPNVVILMAVKLDQLQDVVMKSYNAEFKDVKDKIADPVELMAERYITKLIPYEHRLYLPDLELSLNSKLEILGLSKGNETSTSTTVRDSVLSLIYIKTRFLFYNSPKCASPIIPTNLRDLVELLAMLVKMDDAKADGDIVRPYNQILFKKYFIESWCKSKLRDKDYKFIKELLKTEVVRKNKFTISYITDSFEQIKDSLYKDKNKNEIGKIINKDNLTYNVSLGDVLYVLNTIKNLDDKTNTLNFVFAVKTVYSIFLYELYDEWCEQIESSKLKEIEKSKGQSEEKKDSNEEIFKTKDSLDYPEYFKLIGGAYINSYEYDKIIPSEKSVGSRIYRRLDSELYDFKALINALTPPEPTSSESTSVATTSSESTSLEKVQLLELILLTTSVTYKEDFRSDTVCRYELLGNYSNKKRPVYFDAISVFFNLVRIYYSLIKEKPLLFDKEENNKLIIEEELIFYVPHNKRLYSILKKSLIIYNIFDSIVNGMKSSETKSQKYSSIQSAICIRNVEVLESLMLIDNKIEAGNNLNQLKTLWEQLASFSISTSSDYKIDYNFIMPLSKVDESSLSESFDIFFRTENTIIKVPTLDKFSGSDIRTGIVSKGVINQIINLNKEIIGNPILHAIRRAKLIEISKQIFNSDSVDASQITQAKLNLIKTDFEKYLNDEEEQS